VWGIINDAILCIGLKCDGDECTIAKKNLVTLINFGGNKQYHASCIDIASKKQLFLVRHGNIVHFDSKEAMMNLTLTLLRYQYYNAFETNDDALKLVRELYKAVHEQVQMKGSFNFAVYINTVITVMPPGFKSFLSVFRAETTARSP
jgi:hypothetical protein